MEFLRIDRVEDAKQAGAEAQAEAARNVGAEAAKKEDRILRIYERYLGRFKERRSAVLLQLKASSGGEPSDGEPSGGEPSGGG